jgi:CheY-like chemotaxis protein
MDASEPSDTVPFRASVLVVEDDADLRAAVADTLREAGYEVLEAGDGKRGLTILRDTSIDIVLLDLWLPGMDGWSFRAEQRADSRVREVPVIVMTADDRPQALTINADAILRKPFGTDALQTKIREVLAGRDGMVKSATERMSEAVALVANAVAHEITGALVLLIPGLESIRQEQGAVGNEDAPNPEELLVHGWRIASSLRTLRGLPCPAWTRDVDVNLTDVVRAAIARVRGEGASVALDGEPPAWVCGDPMVLQYLCSALIQNAAEAVPRASEIRAPSANAQPAVMVRVERGNSEVILDVFDSGAPIPEDELDRIFAPNNPGRERAWGAGLRLWFVRQIVETMRGTIEVSNVDIGVKCRVRLPLRAGVRERSEGEPRVSGR